MEISQLHILTDEQLVQMAQEGSETAAEILIEKYRNLASPYYTVDYAELEDGTWRIVEAGDGEVSGLSDNQDYEQYFRALYQCFKEECCLDEENHGRIL